LEYPRPDKHWRSEAKRSAWGPKDKRFAIELPKRNVGILQFRLLESRIQKTSDDITIVIWIKAPMVAAESYFDVFVAEASFAGNSRPEGAGQTSTTCAAPPAERYAP
jgi:hypothetical protein